MVSVRLVWNMEVALRNHQRQLTDVDLDDDDSFALYPRLPPLNTNVIQPFTMRLSYLE